MTKLLEEAIAKVRELPEDQQDAAADALFAHISIWAMLVGIGSRRNRWLR
jgi:hypothetical protein